MKLQAANNCEIIITRNDKETYRDVEALANKIIELDDGYFGLVIAAGDDTYLHLTCDPENFQASELKDLYKQAKKAI